MEHGTKHITLQKWNKSILDPMLKCAKSLYQGNWISNHFKIWYYPSLNRLDLKMATDVRVNM